MNYSYKQCLNRELYEKFRKSDRTLWTSKMKPLLNGIRQEEVECQNLKVQLNSQLIYLN
jgi:hypothetical protein